jgi:hypothetical protein
MPWVRLEPADPATEQFQTDALDRTATGISVTDLCWVNLLELAGYFTYHQV